MNATQSFALSCPILETAGDTIELAHGGGGLMTHRLIDGLFRPAFAASPDDLTHDGAVFDIAGARLAFTTDFMWYDRFSFPAETLARLP